MRVLFTVFPARPHVHPIVPLAWALQNAGHEVRVAIHPDAVDMVTEAGLPVVPLGARETLADAMAWNDNFAELEKLPPFLAVGDELDPEWERQWQGITSMFSQFTPILDDLVEYCRSWRPDLVIWDQFCTAAGVAARVTGAAHARFLWGLDNVGRLRAKSLETLGERGAAAADDPVTKLMAPMLAPYGLEYTEDLLLGQFTIDPMPAALRPRPDLHYESVQRIPYNGNAVVPRWIDETPARPRVCLTLGVGGRGRQLFRVSGVSFAEVVDAIAGMDVELVATLHAAQIETVKHVPANVRLVEYVPLNHLLPSCSAIVHHGGGGSLAAAVAHRVPQLITPLPFWSEEVTARYVAERGAAVLVEPTEFTTEMLVKQLTRVLDDPAVADAIEAMHTESRSVPSPHELATALPGLAERYRG